MSGSPVIRQVRREDIPNIMAFIRSAAEETDPSATPQATEERLAAALDLQGEEQPSSSSNAAPRFTKGLVIVSPSGEVAGHAIYFYSFSTWRAQPGLHLDELFVLRQYRKQGYGKLLMQALAREARRSGCSLLEWNCYRDNERALGFYDGLGAKRMDQWVTLRVVGEEELQRLENGESKQ